MPRGVSAPLPFINTRIPSNSTLCSLWVNPSSNFKAFPGLVLERVGDSRRKMHGGSTPEQEPEDPEAEFVEIDPTGRYGRVSSPNP